MKQRSPASWGMVGGGYNGRVKRWLFTILSVLSLLLFVAVCVLWVRSHVAGDYWGYGAYGGRLYGVSSGKGFVSIDRSELNPLNVRKGADWRLGLPPYYPMWGPARSVPERLGFWWITGRTSMGPFVRVIVPYWFVAGVTLLVPLFWLLRWWRDVPRRRKRLGLCLACGYDLRATPGRCPECGVVAEEARVGHAAKR